MAGIDGIIILDSTGRAIISSHFRAHPPSYPFVHIDAFNSALAKSKAILSSDNGGASSSSSRSGDGKGEELEPILWVNAPASTSGLTGGEDGGWEMAALCHVEREGLRFLVPISQEVNPLLAFTFLDSFLETLTAYLGDVTETSLKDNFDTVYMLIEEMLDEGHPSTMETNMLKDIVLPPTLVRKLLSAAGVSGLHQTHSSPFTTAIPWRRPNPRYSNNEIYFDIEEVMDCLMDKKGKVIKMEVWGRIGCRARLSGNPDLLLNIGNWKVMENCAFHPCIRYKKWTNDHVLSFIPPDGNFKLLEYQVAKPEEGGVGVQRRIIPPVVVKPVIKVDEFGGKFVLTVKTTPMQSNQPLENIVISIYLGSGATSVSATATGDRRQAGFNGGSGGRNGNGDVGRGFVGGGIWEFDPNTKVLKWVISSLVVEERAASLSGSFTSSDQHPLPSPTLQVGFEINQHTFSTIKVDQLKVLNDAQYKPFKGLRNFAKSGKFEVRW